MQTCDLCTETHGREGAAGTGVPAAGEARSRYFLDKMVLRDLLLFYTLCDSTIKYKSVLISHTFFFHVYQLSIDDLKNCFFL